MKKAIYKVVITTTRQFNAVYYVRKGIDLVRLLNDLHRNWGDSGDGTEIVVRRGSFPYDDSEGGK